MSASHLISPNESILDFKYIIDELIVPLGIYNIEYYCTFQIKSTFWSTFKKINGQKIVSYFGCNDFSEQRNVLESYCGNQTYPNSQSGYYDNCRRVICGQVMNWFHHYIQNYIRLKEIHNMTGKSMKFACHLLNIYCHHVYCRKSYNWPSKNHLLFQETVKSHSLKSFSNLNGIFLTISSRADCEN